ncbi:tail fiber assembly protein [Cupriavidus necator]|uniref:tail fiber assembly protein n=1 Tax=Cupriavidus necator TaxID=106590 RepID=UPI003ED10B0B
MQSRDGLRIIGDQNGNPVGREKLPPPSLEELQQTRYALLQLATPRINPLQDAVDLDVATAAETASLTTWKQYRVALNRLDLTVTSVTWPEQPT